MRAVELFAGIGGFRVACDSLGIETVWANDISDAAAKVYRENFGSEGFFFGDINDFIEDIPEHEILTGGFPCQPFSSAGRKLGLEDARGTLFEKIVRILKLRQPKYFVLENVKRLLSMDQGKHFATILDALCEAGYLVEWRLLNAMNFGLPQHRERIVITGRLNAELNSVLCTEQDLRELNPRQIASVCNVHHWKKIEEHSSKFLPWGVAHDGKFSHALIKEFSDAKPPVLLREVLEDRPSEEYFFTKDTHARIQNSERVDRFYNGVEILYNQKGGARMGYSIFGTNGLAPTLTCTTSRHYERYKVGGEFRRLTPVEYARIQGFPDAHCSIAKRYDQYTLYGNAVPPNLVEWAIARLVNGVRTSFSKTVMQMELV